MYSEIHLNQLRSVHRLLTRIRTEAYHGAPSQKIGRVLDDAEYLLDLTLRGMAHVGAVDDSSNSHDLPDDTIEFRAFLTGIESGEGGKYAGLVAAFDAGRTEDVATVPSMDIAGTAFK